MRSLLNEVRILFAELLVHRALSMMPPDAPEAKRLDEYLQASAQHVRWQRWPA